MEKENEERINQLQSEKHELERKLVSFMICTFTEVHGPVQKEYRLFFFLPLSLCLFALTCLLQWIIVAPNIGSAHGRNSTNGRHGFRSVVCVKT